MSRWYRAYEGTIADPKIGEAALVAGTSKSVAIASWHAILESAASVQESGRFDTTARRVAAALGEPLAALESIFAAFDEIGLTADGVVTAWARRQYESDKSATRTKQWRDKKRASGDGHVTSHAADVTPPETETETEKKPSSEGSTRKPKRKVGATCPEDYAPKDRHYGWAGRNGRSREWVDGEARRMKNWSAANANRDVARKSDWDAALDHWLDTTAQKQTAAPTGTGPPIRKSPGLSAAEAGMRFLNARRSDEPSQFDLNGRLAGSDQGYGGPGGPLLEQGGGDRWEAEADHLERSRSFG
jgi:hypothetical protein